MYTYKNWEFYCGYDILTIEKILDILNKVKKPKIRVRWVDDVIDKMRSVLHSWGYTYSNIKERIFASHLIKNSEWRDTIENLWVSDGELVMEIMKFANADDSWWKGKINWMGDFYYKWGTLLNQMKATWKFNIKSKKEEEDRKLKAKLYFESMRHS